MPPGYRSIPSAPCSLRELHNAHAWERGDVAWQDAHESVPLCPRHVVQAASDGCCCTVCHAHGCMHPATGIYSVRMGAKAAATAATEQDDTPARPRSMHVHQHASRIMRGHGVGQAPHLAAHRTHTHTTPHTHLRPVPRCTLQLLPQISLLQTAGCLPASAHSLLRPVLPLSFQGHFHRGLQWTALPHRHSMMSLSLVIHQLILPLHVLLLLLLLLLVQARLLLEAWTVGLVRVWLLGMVGDSPSTADAEVSTPYLCWCSPPRPHSQPCCPPVSY